jgi:hypothetical protein
MLIGVVNQTPQKVSILWKAKAYPRMRSIKMSQFNRGYKLAPYFFKFFLILSFPPCLFLASGLFQWRVSLKHGSSLCGLFQSFATLISLFSNKTFPWLSLKKLPRNNHFFSFPYVTCRSPGFGLSIRPNFSPFRLSWHFIRNEFLSNPLWSVLETREHRSVNACILQTRYLRIFMSY